MLFDESVTIFRKLGNRNAVSNSLTNLGAVTFAHGDYRTARAYFVEALTTAQEFGGKIVISHALDGLAALAAERGDSQCAAQLAGAAEELRGLIGFKREPAETRFRDAYLTKLQQKLSEETLLVAYEQGCKLKLDEAIALAIAVDAFETPERVVSAGN
jgi:hypothetical protein